MQSDSKNQSQGDDTAVAALINKFGQAVKHSRETKDQYYKNIKRNRAFVKGYKFAHKIKTDYLDVTTEEQKDKVKANIIYSTMAAVLPRIYAKNPEIVVNPTEAVDPSQYQLVKGFCRTLNIVLNKYLEKAFLKKRAKGAIRSAQSGGLAWVKVSFQKDIRKDPIILNRIQDIQDNLRRIQYLQDQDNDEGKEENEAKQVELQQQIKALQAKVDIVLSEGLVIDLLLSEHVTIDDSVKNFDDYRSAEWICHEIYYNKDRYEEVFGACPETSSVKYQRGMQSNNATDDDPKTEYRVFELWHRVSNTVYTFCEGAKKWAREPYQPNMLGEHWYPFFPLGFNIVDGQFEPMSDVELLKNLQDEYHNTREQQEEHRRLSKPTYITDQDTNEDDIKRKQHAELGEIIIVDAQGKALREVFQVENPPQYNPLIYDTTPIRSDVELVSGMGDAARGNIQKAKTLGEAEILQESLSSRSDERKDNIEDWIQAIAQYGAEILLQRLKPEQVYQIAGPPAQMQEDGKMRQGSVWPQISHEQALNLVSIEIRAGSTGKPNKVHEQKTWIEFLPQMQDLIRGVHEARQAGNFEFANSFIKLAEETLRRFDERIDVEEFLPQETQDNKQQVQQDQAMAERMATMQAEMQKLEAEIRKINSEAFKNEVDAQVAARVAVQPIPQISYPVQ